jgi:peptidoglycan-N-acetylglucosamine deacetylase
MNPWLIAAPAVTAGIAACTAYGAIHPHAEFFGRTLSRSAQPQQLALTFDDGPNPAITSKFLDLLDRYQAKAAFFVVGKYVRESPGLVKEIVARGHELCNHTDSHPNLFFCSPQRTADELQRCTDSVQNVVGFEPKWFRPPFGFRSPWVIHIAQRLRMRTVMWTLLPGDWRAPSTDWLSTRLQPIAVHARKNLSSAASHSRLRGDILCLHDGHHRFPNADRTRTLAALEFWLPRWRDLGLEFVTITQAAGKAVEA